MIDYWKFPPLFSFVWVSFQDGKRQAARGKQTKINDQANRQLLQQSTLHRLPLL